MSFTAPPALRPEHPQRRPLSELIRCFSLEKMGNSDDITVTGVSLNSSDIQPGDLYVGLPGRHAHGASYARTAADAGAVAILTDRSGVSLAEDAGLPVLVTPDVRAVLGRISAWVYRTDVDVPQLLAVTGTNGKTSVVYILNGILRQMGVAAGLSSTAERRIGDVVITSALTTPEATELHALLARMREAQLRCVAVEVSAQALSRHRVDGLVFDVVGFTNLSHDHLDDYRDFDEYFEAKVQLFQPDRAGRAVVIVDTEWGRSLVSRSHIPVTTLTTVANDDAEWRMTVLEETADHTAFRLDGPGGQTLTTQIPLLGSYMAANAALAIVMLVEAGYDLEAMSEVFTAGGQINVYVPGRAETISGETGPLVLIDYGHSPDAFSHTLAALQKVVTGRIIMLFGADGDRDTTKRGEMGAIAARGADSVVVTDFNPRREDPAAIRRTLIAAAREARPDCDVYEHPDPRDAFRFALSLAHDGDAILYAGPGHEDYQDIAGEKIPYSARNDARAALSDAGWPPREASETK